METADSNPVPGSKTTYISRSLCYLKVNFVCCDTSSHYVLADIARVVAVITEGELRIESETVFHNSLGWPGQRHVKGKAFGCSV
jgi:hypothetical protein